MKGFDVLHLKSAVKDRNRFPELSRTHETSMDIGQINVLFNEELVPSDEIPVKAKFFARTAPLVKPTFGRILFKTVSMFVPYHQVAEDAEAFIAGKTSWLGQTPVLRYITADDIAVLFTSSTQYCTQIGASATNYDVVILNASAVPQYFLFTNVGRYLNKLLNQLGYFIPENLDGQPGSYWNTIGKNKKFSAYALLAFFKGYNDWMSQSQRYNISQLSYALLNIRQNKAFTGYSTNGHLDYRVIDLFFQNLLLNYDNDYFTSAWQNPNAPLNFAENVANPSFPSTFADFLNSPTGTIAQFPVSTTPDTTIYQRALDLLKSFDDWVRRNNYAGSRDVQQIYARFGIKVDDYRTHYAHVVGTSEQYINVGDVTATAETSQAILGDYAGKAIVDCEVNVEYKSSDYGLFMILGYITVKPQMAFGFDRKNLRTEPLDWYNPEFDGVGGDPITYREVFESCKINPSTDLSNGDAVFGFTERYNSYRYGRDQITGDFKVFKDMDVWHCGRDLSALRAGATMIAQSSSMNTLAQSDSEYNRIFSVQTGDADHFYFICQFDVNALRPMLSLSQVPQLGTGDTEVSRNGNVIN